MSVYIIRCKDKSISDCYIGSTKRSIEIREQNHKFDCNNSSRKAYHYKLYKYIRDNGGWDNWDIVEICKCENLLETEQYYIDFIKPSLNHRNPTRIHYNKYRQNWIIENPNKIKLQRKRQNRKSTCDICGKELNIRYIENHKRRKHN